MSKVLIFGANGFVGEYLAREFRDYNYEVIGSGRGEQPRHVVFSDYYAADIMNAREVENLLRLTRPDMVVNLAAISSVGVSWQDPRLTFQVNVVGALNILEATRLHAPEAKVLLVGSSEEYAPADGPLNESSLLLSNNPYGVSKVTQENIAEIYSSHYGMRVYRVRAFNHLGVGQSCSFAIPSWCKQVAAIEKSGKPGLVGVGNLIAVRDFSDVRDVVRAYRLILESEFYGEVFNVGSGIGRSLSDVLHEIIRFSEQQVTVAVKKELFRPADTPSIVCDREKIGSKLGWCPAIPLTDTLYAVYRSHLDSDLSAQFA